MSAYVDVLPVAMIPAVSLIILTLNNRLAPLLKVLREIIRKEKASRPGDEKFFFLRIRCLQIALLCAYTALLFFTAAAFFIILSTIATHLLYIIVILLITGCFMTFLGVISAIVEVSYATTLFSSKEDIFRKR